MESLSSYARQFLGQMEKPNVESIEGLPPAISIDQKSPIRTHVQLSERSQRYMITSDCFMQELEYHTVLSAGAPLQSRR